LSVYADTSFLVSLYVLDANSAAAVARMTRTRLPLYLSSLGEIELGNAINLRVFRREIRAAAAKSSRELVRKDIEEGVLAVRPFTTAAIERAKQISLRRTPRLGTRTLGVLHVAVALTMQATVFYTFEERQARLAAAEGIALR
jgi:predicted nucleic acid-binding protein